jgi:hypothetical protein
MFTLMLQFAKAADKAITAGRDEYARLAKAGTPPTVPALQMAVLANVKDYKPELKGKTILTPALRSSLSGALAHLAFNLASADGGKELV